MTRGRIRLGTPEEFERFYCGRINATAWLGYVEEIEGVVVAVAGVMWDLDGECWGFIDCKPQYMPSPRTAVALTRAILDTLRQCGEPFVKAYCDTTIPKAKRFLEWAGFTPNSDGVWQWTR